MKDSKQLLSVFAMLLMLVSTTSQLQAQEEKQKEERSRKNRRSWIMISPPAPIPPIAPVQPIPVMMPLPPVAPITPIHPMMELAPMAPIAPVGPVLSVAPVAPVVPMVPSVPTLEDVEGFYLKNKGLTIREHNGFYTEVQGKVRLDRDKKLVRSISRNGYIKIKDKNSGKEILVEEEDGVLYYNYYNRGRKLPFENEGKAWLEDIWGNVVRQIGR